MIEKLLRWPWVGDLLLAVGIALPVLPASIILVSGPWREVLIVAAVAGHVALAVRRTWPALCFGIVSAAMAVQALAPAGAYEGFLPSAVVFPVALYTICAYGKQWLTWAALAVGVAGAGMLTVREPGDFWQRATVFGLLLVVVLACWGFALLRKERTRQAQLEAETLVTDERNRIAREMHDVVAHSLSVIITQAQGAELIAAKSPDRAVTALGTIAATGRQALAEMRGVLSVLGPPQPTLNELDRLIENAGIKVTRQVIGEPVALGPSAELAVYRLVQEALTNIMRHAGTGRATVTLDWSEPGKLTVSVRDNGIGGMPRFGRGLTGMRQRFEALGGTLEAGPRDNGFEVRGVLPA